MSTTKCTVAVCIMANQFSKFLPLNRATPSTVFIFLVKKKKTTSLCMLYQIVASESYLTLLYLQAYRDPPLCRKFKGTNVPPSCQTSCCIGGPDTCLSLASYPSGYGRAAGGFSARFLSSIGNNFGSVHILFADLLGGAFRRRTLSDTLHLCGPCTCCSPGSFLLVS